jgi:hypothetical protein
LRPYWGPLGALPGPPPPWGPLRPLLGHSWPPWAPGPVKNKKFLPPLTDPSENMKTSEVNPIFDIFWITVRRFCEKWNHDTIGVCQAVASGHGLPKVLHRPAMPDPFTPCGRAISETASRPFQGWPTHRAGGLQPSSIPLETPRHMGLHDTVI